jgi:hypothetical protein
MNCRYVTSQTPFDDPLLVPAGVFAEDPGELNPGNDGPFLYRNLAALPRAMLARTGVALVDGDAEEGLRLLLGRRWDPRRAVYLRLTTEELAADDANVLARLSAVVVGSRAGDLRAARARAGQLGVTWTAMQPGADTGPLAGAELAPGTPLADPEYGWRDALVDVGEPAEPCWLVLADTFAIYPGWSARVDGVPAPLLQANGAATAIPIPAGAREVRLSYLPDGFVLGMAISAAGLAVAAAVLLVLARAAAP